MEKKNLFLKKALWTIVGVSFLFLSSCRTTRRTVSSVAVVKPMNTNRLIRNIENSAFDYSHLSIKRISCQFDNGKTKASFRASIHAERNREITVMLSKLNIPIGRAWLTPDSVKFINYLEKTYFLDNYTYLSSMLGLNIDFQTVQNILSNNILSFSKGGGEKPEYQSLIDSGFYVLQSVKELKMNQEARKQAGERGPDKKRGKLNANSPFNERIYIDPETFKLRKIRIDDPMDQRKLNISFDDYTSVEKQLYPGEISLDFVSPESKLQLRSRFAGFSLENEKEVKFRVPEKFTRINHE
jgi:hypothetical protein